MIMKILLINDREPFDEAFLEPFKGKHEVVCYQIQPEEFDLEVVINQHSDADVIIVTYIELKAENLAKFTNLKAIIATTTATEYIDLNYAKDHHIKIFNNPGYTQSAVAEHLLSLVLSVARRIPRLSEKTKAADFEQFDQVGFELSGKTLGILGMGSVGQRFAQLASGLDMTIQYYNRSNKDVPYTFVDFDTLLSSSDVIAVTLPLSQETSQLFNQETINKMKDNSIIASISPDGLFNIDDLVSALHNQKFWGLGLDIHHPRPKLYPFENVVLTPTKGWYTKECMSRRTQAWVETLRGYLAY